MVATRRASLSSDNSCLFLFRRFGNYQSGYFDDDNYGPANKRRRGNYGGGGGGSKYGDEGSVHTHSGNSQ